jgi:hypothetical protein
MQAKPVFRLEDLKNLELVRQIILNRLKYDSDWNQFDYTWGESSRRFVEFERPELREHFIILATEIMWQLVIQGVITPGMNSSNLTLPFFRVTEYGREVLQAERFVPHDSTGYLMELKMEAKTVIGNVAITYVEEALRCFNAGCHLASVLLLGIAAESVFLELCTVIYSSLTRGNDQRTLSPKQPIKQKHRWIINKYLSLPSSVRREQLPESLDLTLTSLYELIRRQRNDLGHPQEKPPELNREQAFIYFRLFPGFVADVEAFADYCRKNRL